MKKFLQKTLAVLALCLVSVSAMAQDASITLLESWNWSTQVDQDVTIEIWCGGYDGNINPCGDGQYVEFTAPAGKKFKEIRLGGLHKYSGDHANMKVDEVGVYDSSANKYIWTGSSSTVRFSRTGSLDVVIRTADIWYETEGGGGSTGPVVVPDGTAVTEFVDGMEYTLAVVSYYYNYKRFWNLNAAGNDIELSAGSEGTRYTCEVHGSKVAFKAPNGKYLRIKQSGDVSWMTNYSLNGLADTYDSQLCDFTIETYSGYANGIGIKGTRGIQNGSPYVGYFCASYTNYGQSGWSFSGNSSIGWAQNYSTIFEARQYTPTTAAPITYTVDFVGAPVGAEVTLDGETLSADNNTYDVAKNLDEDDLVVVDPAGYWTEVDFDGEDTFTVTYHAYNYYNVTVSGAVGGALVYDDAEYTSGQIEAKNVLTLGDVEAKKIAGYDAEVTSDGTTFTVTYTAYPTVTIGANASDSEGNYWTSFSFHHPVSFADGVTPCLVTGTNNGVLTVQEYEASNDEFTFDVDFTKNYGMYSYFDTMDGNLHVEGTYWDFNTGYGYAENFEINTDDWSTLTFTLSNDYEGIIKSLTFVNNMDGTQDWYDYGAGYGECSEIPVNGKTVTLGAYYGRSLKHVYLKIEAASIPVFPANTGILVKASEAKAVNYTVHEDGDVNVDTSANLLQASGENGFQVSNDPNYLYYMLSRNAANEAGSEGFYWGKNSDQGHSIVMPAHKAYLKLRVAAASNRAAFFFGGDNIITAIEGISTEADNTPVFNLQGQRVNATKAGVYVKNGRKFIVK